MTESTLGENSTINSVFSEYSENSKKRNEIVSLLEQAPDIKLINIISDLLKDICKENNSIETNNKNIEINKKIRIFMLKKIPPISIKDYLLRLCKYSKISASTLIFILIYIDRLCQKYKFKINYFNIYKFILTSMVIAIKCNEDEFFSSEFYAKLGGISKAEMNFMEYEFLTMINFNLFVKEELFFKYHNLLINDGNEELYEDEKEEKDDDEGE
jgi:hypothetical protein